METGEKQLGTGAIRLMIGFNIIGYLDGGFGLAQVPKAIARVLDLVRIPYSIFKFKNMVQIEEKSALQNSEELNNTVDLYFFNAETIREIIRKRNDNGNEADRYRIGIWFWELERFPEKYYPSFSELDEIWVFSSFIFQSLSAVSPIPVRQMTYPYFPPSFSFPSPGNTPRPFTCLMMFDFWSDIRRKNPFGAIEAFRNAFRNGEETRLIIKCINGERFPEDMALLRRVCGNDERIQVLDEAMPRNDLYLLFAEADVYLSLHRAEGLGLNILDAIFFELPVIITSYGGNMDYLKPEYSYLVKYEKVTIETSHYIYSGRGVWAEPDVGQASCFLREIYDNRDQARVKAINMKACMLSSMNPSRCAEKIIQRTEQIKGLVTKGKSTRQKRQVFEDPLERCVRLLPDRGSSQVLIFLTARGERVIDIILRLKKMNPRLSFSLFGRRDERFHNLVTKFFAYESTGLFSKENIPEATRQEMVLEKFDLVLVPFYNSYGDNYGNIMDILALLECQQILGIGIADDLFRIDVENKSMVGLEG